MTRTLQRPATYDDLLKVPDHLVAEIVEGELYASPRPSVRHAHAATVLSRRIGSAFEDGDGGPGGWWLLFEPELHLGPDVIVPDLAAWRRERVPELPDVAAITTAPDWICEVISPATGELDRRRKMPAYARHRVEYAWIIDPRIRIVEASRLESGRWSQLGVYGGDESARIEPFDAIEIDLSRLWLPESPSA
ncbi:MAG TPA: Uma2 family endonuclease [Thermoanaerobaculia bacterium]|nr:Uma2 family endonuclease [Thermoanaerobaculia bacterium]